MDGKLTDVLVKGYELGLRVWADPGMGEIIASVSGVTSCKCFNPTEYLVRLDPRYDVEWIKLEIVARVKIGN